MTRKQTEKHVSHFSKIYFIVIMAYILFLLYYIYTEFVKVNMSTIYLLEKQHELVLLHEKYNRLEKVKNQMSTPQYQDRINKEIKGILQEGEHEFSTPKIEHKTDIEIQSEQAEVYLQKPIIEEWKEVFHLNLKNINL